MAYLKAEEILPEEVIKIIQQYADGVNIYIPRKNERKGWGTQNNAKTSLYKRNRKIYEEYKNGASICCLSKKYFLSDKSIWRILKAMKNEL